MNLTWKKRIARVLGNFGVSFFTPLASSSIGDLVFQSNMTFEQAIIISAINATFYTGLAISQEVQQYGKEKGVPSS